MIVVWFGFGLVVCGSGWFWVGVDCCFGLVLVWCWSGFDLAWFRFGLLVVLFGVGLLCLCLPSVCRWFGLFVIVFGFGFGWFGLVWFCIGRWVGSNLI